MIGNIAELIDFDSDLVEIYTKLSNDEELDKEQVEFVLYKLLHAIIKANKNTLAFKHKITTDHIKNEYDRLSIYMQKFIEDLKKEYNKDWIDVIPLEKYKKFFNEVILKNKHKGDAMFDCINPSNEFIRANYLFEEDNILCCNIDSICSYIFSLKDNNEFINSIMDGVFSELFDLPVEHQMQAVFRKPFFG